MLTGLNHITIAVSDLDVSLAFYQDLLGFKGHMKWNGGAYLSLGSLWFCLSCDNPCPATDYTHIAFDITETDFDDFCIRLLTANVSQWKANSSEGKSLYILDPDGHKLEIHTGDLHSRLAAIRSSPYEGVEWFV